MSETTAPGPATGKLFWSRRISLTTRILALNIIALALMAGSLFYLDSLRKQLIAERFKLARSEVEITADALSETRENQRRPLLARIAREQQLRLRLYDARGQLLADSFTIAEPAFAFVDPASEPWYQQAARARSIGRWIGWSPRPKSKIIASLHRMGQPPGPRSPRRRLPAKASSACGMPQIAPR